MRVSRRPPGTGRGNSDALDLAAPERVDGLVRVADDDEIAAAAGEQGEQLLLRRIGVLVLVDDHEGAGVALAGEQPGFAAEQIDSRPDQLGRVVRRWVPKAETLRTGGRSGNGGPAVMSVR